MVSPPLDELPHAATPKPSASAGTEAITRRAARGRRLDACALPARRLSGFQNRSLIGAFLPFPISLVENEVGHRSTPLQRIASDRQLGRGFASCFGRWPCPSDGLVDYGWGGVPPSRREPWLSGALP